jgi:hypothetical protein
MLATFYGGPMLGDIVRCVWCGGENLHHEGLTVFGRSEDNDKTLEIEISRMGEWPTAATRFVPSSQSANPSFRRTGLTVQFWCELCPGLTELRIAQHKGTTYSELAKNGKQLPLE